MATLQQSFAYAGDASSAAIKNVNLRFSIPSFEFTTVIRDGKPFPEREQMGKQVLSLNQQLLDTDYTVSFPNDWLTGVPDAAVLSFWSFLRQVGFTSNEPEVPEFLRAAISVGVTDEQNNLFDAVPLEAIFSLSTASDKFREITENQAGLNTRVAINTDAAHRLQEQLISYIRENIFILNRQLFDDAASQFRAAEPRYNEYALLYIISHVTYISEGRPRVKIEPDAFRTFLKNHFGIGSEETIRMLIGVIKDELFDFPLTVPEITSAEIKGKFRITTRGNSPVSPNDFRFFELAVGYTVKDPGGLTMPVASRFDWAAIDQAPDNTVPFSFDPVIVNFINSQITVRVKGYDGSVTWEKKYSANDPDLADLLIEVPLLRPGVIGENSEPLPTGGNKKLAGKVVEMSGTCKLKDVTVVVQAKKQDDTIWRIVGAGTTDSSGNFSIPYPYGQFVAAQALTSLTPDSPADININTDDAHLTANETIADDFLYLLLTNVICEDSEEEEDDCACHDTKKSNRLPDQEELIKSDSYTQDIGGSCINLSTPNRTLSEYAEVAIVRTSDPDVSNYVLSKDPKGNFVLQGGLSKISRSPVDLTNPIRWQDAPDAHANLSFYQAVTVATGHILHYSITTKADGYSLGELLYSLPLAPGQKKEIVMFEQSHTLTGSETQSISQRESLAASLVNDVTITDTIAGNLSESTRGSSSATTSGVSAGLGLAGIVSGIAGAFGVSGGVANSHSNASQNSSRSLSEYFHEQMKNAINQNARSYREMNASVVTTVQEGQRYGVTTEVVANHNHCHSLTMMYFEVLRHYAIYQELSYVEECLFIPLLMTDFRRDNVYKWRDLLAANLLPMPSETYLQPFTMIKAGRQHPLLKGFDAIERIKTNYANVDFPPGAYDDELIMFVTGELFIQTNLPRPKSKYDRIKSWPLERKTSWSWSGALIGGILGGLLGAYLNADGSVKAEAYPIIDEYMSVDANFASVSPAQCIRIKKIDSNFFEDGGFDKAQWEAYARLLGRNVFDMLSYYFKERLIAEWDSIFFNDIAPLLFERIVRNISIGGFSALDLSSESKYKGGNVQMRINLRGNGSNKKRKEIAQLQLAFNNTALLTNDLVTLTTKNITLRYSTAHYNGVLYSGFAGDDLIDGSLLYTPENANEKRNPRNEDAYIANKLIEHLNSNLEHYNKELWRKLDRDRRYMLLDGFNVETYNDFGLPVGFRSLASVVKNELVGISGNSLIMPVAPGYKIDRTFIVEQPIEGPAVEIDLLEHYKPLTPIPPYRISIPSRGIFAEAVQGACDACEKVKENSSQDWDKFRTDEPTDINPVTVPVPTVTDWRAAFREFASPLVSIQNAPAAPAPGAGLAGVSDVLGKSDAFRDITGLDQNQKNAMQTYLSNQQNAKDFAQMAKDIFTMGHNTEHSDKIADSIRNSPELTKEEKAALLKDHFGQMVDGGKTKQADEASQQNNKPSLTDAAIKAAEEGKAVKATNVTDNGKAESVDIGAGDSSGKVLAQVLGFVPEMEQDNDNACWAFAATIMMSWKNKAQQEVSTVLREADNGGSEYVDMYTAKQALPSGHKKEFITNLGMIDEQPGENPGVQQFIDWVRTYGPIWLTTDSDAGEGKFSPHARILTKITGTGTPDGIGTSFEMIDPKTGSRKTQRFNDFMTEYKQMVLDNKSPDPYIQVVHFEERIVGEGGSGAKASKNEFELELAAFQATTSGPSLNAAITRLKSSAAFKAMLVDLNKAYISQHSKFPQLPIVLSEEDTGSPLPDTDMETAKTDFDEEYEKNFDETKGRFKSGPLSGRRVITIRRDHPNNGSFFKPYDGKSNAKGDLLIAHNPPDSVQGDPRVGQWLETVAHETAHCWRFIKFPAPSATTKVAKINAAIAEEMETRKQEKKIVSQSANGLGGGFVAASADANYVLKSVVQRDFVSGDISVTYLENYTLEELEKEAITNQGLSPTDVEGYNKAVKEYPMTGIDTSVAGWEDQCQIITPNGLMEPAAMGYSRLRFIRRIIDAGWKASDEADKEAVLQAHLTRFFPGLVAYAAVGS